jgi:hypothetical protein
MNCQLYNSAKVTLYPFRTRFKVQLYVEGSSELELVKLVPMGSCWTCPWTNGEYTEKDKKKHNLFLLLLLEFVSFEFLVMMKRRRS